MNDEIKPLYIPEASGNTLPDLRRHGSHNETPVPLHRVRSAPSHAMSDQPMKYLLPGGAELRDIIKRRIEATSQSTKALCAALARAYQIRGGHYESVLNEIAGMINSGELVQRDDELRVAEPPAAEIPAEMWTMSQTERLLSVLGTEPRTRAWLAERTGLKPKQVSKAMHLLIERGKAVVVGDVPRTWVLKNAKTEEPKPEIAVLSESQTRAVLLERVAGACDEEVVIADVTRLSGWQRGTVAALIESLLREGALTRLDDRRISRPLVKQEDPPEYVVGDEDDGEIPEPGVGRPATAMAPWVVYDGAGWTNASSEQEARRIAEFRATDDSGSAVYRRVAVCRLRPEWVDGREA